MMPPATERQYFWMIDGQSKELDYTTSPAFDTVIKILRYQAAIVISDLYGVMWDVKPYSLTHLSVTSQIRQCH